MKVRLLSDGGYKEDLSQVSFPIIVNATFLDNRTRIIMVSGSEFNIALGYYPLFSPDEYELMMKFKIGDKVIVADTSTSGSIYSINDSLHDKIEYSVEDEEGQTSWWSEEDLEPINEQIS